MCALKDVIVDAGLEVLKMKTSLFDITPEPSQVNRFGKFIRGETYYTRKGVEFVAGKNNNGKIIPVVFRQYGAKKVKRGGKVFLQEFAICEHAIAKNQRTGKPITVKVHDIRALRNG